MRTYNPLDVDELGRNAAGALMGYPAIPLPPERFDGAGVYTLHYTGGFPAYAGMGDEAIYVGRAEPPGKRQGRRTGPVGRVLHQRLVEHAGSIEHAENLDVDDFRCRWLVIDPVWITLTEQVLIAQYGPVWNAIVDGFGHHDQGRSRRTQKRSRWDTLHPGRPWAALQQDNADSVEAILERIAAHRRSP